jgi:hypothetical protein
MASRNLIEPEVLDSRDVRSGVPPLQRLQAGVGGAFLDGNEQAVDDPAEVGISAAVVETPDGHSESVATPDCAWEARNFPRFFPYCFDGFGINGSFTHALRVGFPARGHKLRAG